MPSQSDELAALQEQLDALDASKEAAVIATKLEVAKLRLEHSRSGKEGYDFSVVPTAEGVVVVQRVAAIVSKKWREAVTQDKLTPAAAYAYTASGVVVPDAKTYEEWHNKNDLVALTVSIELGNLYAAAAEVRKGK